MHVPTHLLLDITRHRCETGWSVSRYLQSPKPKTNRTRGFFCVFFVFFWWRRCQRCTVSKRRVLSSMLAPDHKWPSSGRWDAHESEPLQARRCWLPSTGNPHREAMVGVLPKHRSAVDLGFCQSTEVPWTWTVLACCWEVCAAQHKNVNVGNLASRHAYESHATHMPRRVVTGSCAVLKRAHASRPARSNKSKALWCFGKPPPLLYESETRKGKPS